MDFFPDMTKNEMRPIQNLDNAKCYQIWHGQAVYNIGICQEESEEQHQIHRDDSGG